MLDRKMSQKFHDLFLMKRDQVGAEFKKLVHNFVKNHNQDDMQKLIPDILNENVPIPLEMFVNDQTKDLIVNSLLQYISTPNKTSNWSIKKERAYLLLSKLVDKSYAKEIDAIENEDFAESINSINHLSHLETKWDYANGTKLEVKCPMKVALSSANNSDRHGAAKMEGSKVLNLAANLFNEETGRIEPSIVASLEILDTQSELVFEAYNDLSGSFQWSCMEINSSNAKCLIEDQSTDPYRFYKYSLFFSGILKNRNDPWSDLMNFTNGKGLKLKIVNNGPSKSGFSSSSAIMVTLLRLFYKCSGQIEKLDQVYHLALVAECNLGLRSGWNDTFCLQPGIHDFYTLPTTSLPNPIMKNIDVKGLDKRLCLIHTGLQRSASNRMNRRHEVYLSKDLDLYPLLIQSLMIHDEIVAALGKQDWKLLGTLLLEYMDYRIGFDRDATNEYLQFFFKHLMETGLIYGGLLAGAMGGGIAQVILSDECTEEKLSKELATIQDKDFNGMCPFKNPLFKRIHFQVNFGE